MKSPALQQLAVEKVQKVVVGHAFSRAQLAISPVELLRPTEGLVPGLLPRRLLAAAVALLLLRSFATVESVVALGLARVQVLEDRKVEVAPHLRQLFRLLRQCWPEGMLFLAALGG